MCVHIRMLACVCAEMSECAGEYACVRVSVYLSLCVCVCVCARVRVRE